MTASSLRDSDRPEHRGSDPITWYLSSIGREPLLTPAEEIELGNQVQAMMALDESGAAKLSPCLLYTSPSPRDATLSRMPSSA